MSLEVKAFGSAPFAERRFIALSPSGRSNILCSRKCATPDGVSMASPSSSKRRSAPP